MSHLDRLLVTASSEVEETNTEVLLSQTPRTQFTQHVLIHLQEQTDRRTYRQTQTDRQTDRETDNMDPVHSTGTHTSRRTTDVQTQRETDRQTHVQTDTDRRTVTSGLHIGWNWHGLSAGQV